MIVITTVFLVIALCATCVSSLGILMARDCFDRLHYLGPVTFVGSLCILLAVATYEGFSQITGKVSVAIVILLITGPVVTHAIARAGMIRGDALRLRKEDWEVKE